jgi:hypothetical protein
MRKTSLWSRVDSYFQFQRNVHLSMPPRQPCIRHHSFVHDRESMITNRGKACSNVDFVVFRVIASAHRSNKSLEVGDRSSQETGTTGKMRSPWGLIW